MLEITIPEREMYNEQTGEFITLKEQKLQLEHSLISLSKWESKWKKPFLGDTERTREEILDYIRCMTLNQHVDPLVYDYIPFDVYQQVYDYIKNDQTATKIYDRRPKRGKSETITSELIYYWMIFHGIPKECEKWHLSRLLILIQICSIKGSNEQMSMKELFADNRRLNNMRKGAAK